MRSVGGEGYARIFEAGVYGVFFALRMQAPSYRDRLNVVVTYVQALGEYLGRCRVRLGADSQILRVGDADSDEERGDPTPSLQDHEYIVEFPPGPSLPGLLYTSLGE